MVEQVGESMGREFESKVVVITGAAGVIGTWIADAFAAEGAILVLSDKRRDQLDSMKKEGRWGASEVLIHESELSDAESLKDLVSAVEKRWGAPHILVNNAGVYPHSPLLEVELEEWNRIINVNLTAPFVLTKSFAGLMIGKGIRGSIVNILSGASLTVSRNGVPYSVSKAALLMLTRGSALELAPHKIRVNGVSPGFAAGSEVSPLDNDYVERMIRSIPLGRMSGPNDAASAVLYLSSEKASFITGTMLSVDGGRTAGPVTL